MADDPFPDVLDMRQVAKKLGKSVRWLEGHVRAHPCGRKIGAKRVFTPADYAALLNTFPKDTGPTLGLSRRSAHRSIRPGGQTEAEISAELERLLGSKLRRRVLQRP